MFAADFYRCLILVTTFMVFRRTWTDAEELLKEVFFHTFLCVLVWICNQKSSDQHVLVVGCWNVV